MQQTFSQYTFYWGIFSTTHREIFSNSYYINPKSDCIHHFPIELELNGRQFAVPNQSENDKYNQILVLFNKISLCVPFTEAWEIRTSYADYLGYGCNPKIQNLIKNYRITSC